MNLTSVLVVALIVLPAVGLAAWAWFAIAQVEAQLHDLNAFEGMHFEIGPEAANNFKGAKWPAPG